MSTPAGVIQRGASLLEADPSLGPLLGPRNAVEIGHRRVLPVLTLPEGDWSPPSAGVLGEATLALVVLAGLLLRRSPGIRARLLGPGDLGEPWMAPAASWSACTPVRAAIIGQEFLHAVAHRPQAAAHMLRRPVGGSDGLAVGCGGATAAEDRLAELLWRLAARWGRPEGDGIVLPFALAPATLAALGDVPAPDAATALQTLQRGGRVTLRADGKWLLRPAGARAGGGLRALRDDLRERAAAALAQARVTQARWAELTEDAAAHVRRGEGRRGAG